MCSSKLPPTAQDYLSFTSIGSSHNCPFPIDFLRKMRLSIYLYLCVFCMITFTMRRLNHFCWEKYFKGSRDSFASEVCQNRMNLGYATSEMVVKYLRCSMYVCTKPVDSFNYFLCAVLSRTA